MRSMIYVCILLSIPAVTSRADDATITPGHRLGKISLGATMSTVHRLLGKPHMSIPEVGEETYEKVRKIGGNTNLYIVYRSGKVAEINTDSPHFSTSRGISTKATYGQICQQFRHLQHDTYPVTDNELYAQVYDDAQHGIGFRFDKEAYLVDGRLVIKEVRPSDHPSSITVHISGKHWKPRIGGP